MGRVSERLQEVKQHHHANRLRAATIKKYADDPDVVFRYGPHVGYDAPHGFNTPEEMMHDAEPVAD